MACWLSGLLTRTARVPRVSLSSQPTTYPPRWAPKAADRQIVVGRLAGAALRLHDDDGHGAAEPALDVADRLPGGELGRSGLGLDGAAAEPVHAAAPAPGGGFRGDGRPVRDEQVLRAWGRCRRLRNRRLLPVRRLRGGLRRRRGLQRGPLRRGGLPVGSLRHRRLLPVRRLSGRRVVAPAPPAGLLGSRRYRVLRLVTHARLAASRPSAALLESCCASRPARACPASSTLGVGAARSPQRRSYQCTPRRMCAKATLSVDGSSVAPPCRRGPRASRGRACSRR